MQRLKVSHNGESILQTQFNTLSSVTPGPDDVIMETALAHPDKNRSDKYLPCEWIVTFGLHNMTTCVHYLLADKHIVPLSHGGYINATFVRVSNTVDIRITLIDYCQLYRHMASYLVQ